jgi:two-component system chemotaxis response regulator CheB
VESVPFDHRADHELIIIGCSAGGLDAMMRLIGRLPVDFSIPIVVVQHISEGSEYLLIEVLARNLNLDVTEARGSEFPKRATVHIAPGGYHLLFELDGSFAVSLEEHQMGSRPSIDIAIEAAADVFKEKLIAIILTGNNEDGKKGIERTLKNGGRVFVQDPTDADFSPMPAAAAQVVRNFPHKNKKLASQNVIARPEEICEMLIKLEETI